MKITINNKKKFISILAIFIVLILLFIIILKNNRENILKRNSLAKNEYEVDLNGISISLDNVISKEPNIPVLGAGMIPIKWDEDAGTWTITTTTDDSWYNYSEGKYANIMLSNEYYKSEPCYGINEEEQVYENKIGAQIVDTQLGTIFTWVPKLTYNDESIEYLQGTSIVEYNWITPSCFTTYLKGYYNIEVTGFWVSKETYNSLDKTNKKNQEMLNEDNIYGLIRNEAVTTITDEERLVIEKLNEKNGNINNETTISGMNQNEYKQVIKITNINQRELITPFHSTINDQIYLKTKYSENGIKYILYKDGSIAGYGENGTYETTNEDQYIFYYVDNRGNIKKYAVSPSDGRPNVKYFNENTTFYVSYDDNGNETSYIPIGEKAPENWYNYNSQKWGNVVCRNNGDELYYVWIPRYMYKLDSSSQTADAILVDLENCYTDENGDRVSLNDSDYILPEAFTWNGTALSGYWVSKYNLSSDSNRRLTATVTTSDNTIRVSDIINKTGITDNVIYNVYLIKDGKIEFGPQKITDSYTFTDVEYGEYSIHIAAMLGENQIAGYANQIKINKIPGPDLTGFKVDSTFIVTYDDYGNETSIRPIGSVLTADAEIDNGILKSGEVDISKLNDDEIWYNYAEQKWPNVVCRNNGEELYYVYIPRYEYLLNSTNQNADVVLISKEQTTADAGYAIPEAFTWNETAISGYWVSKYNLSSDSAIRLTAAINSNGNTIRVSDIINKTGITDDITYKAYLIRDMEIRAESGLIEGSYTFTNLDYGDYTVHVIALSGKNQIAGYVSKVKIQKINEPDLTGFKVDNTFIVTYDNSGNEKSYQPLGDVLVADAVIENGTLKSGEVDTSKIDGVWYNYAEQKWANIVCRNNAEELYYVWIPRYEYLLNSANQYATAIIIPKEQTEPDVGYTIPDAFTWNETAIPGYWFSKYRLTSDSDSRLLATVAGGFDTIRVSNIINNTGTTDGVTYKAYLIRDGKVIKGPVDVSDDYTFTGLEYGTYTVHVTALSGNNQIAGYANSIKLEKIEEPDLTGFMVDNTFIVTYDGDGNENSTQSLRSVLKSDAVVNADGQLESGEVDRNKINGVWYNYAEQKWPNVVCRNNNQTLYYVYIPRYEYILNAGRQRADVILIPKSKTEADAGYTIPDAFTWNSIPISGYWFSKYRLSS